MNRLDMTPERWRQLGELYDAVKDLSPTERSSHLKETDSELRLVIQAIFAQEGSLLEPPAWENWASLLESDSVVTPSTQLGSYQEFDRRYRTAPAELDTFFSKQPIRDLSNLQPCSQDSAVVPGQVLNQRFLITAVLGAGGMGEVYRANDRRLERTVALKILFSHSVPRPDLRRRLAFEAKTISSLNHPHICSLYDLDQDDKCQYLVLEYLEGETLAARLQRGPVSVPEWRRLAVQITSALIHAHQRGIIHRDIKPANIMLTANGAKLLDFGIAKQTLQHTLAEGMSASHQLDRRLIVGTLPYMSPEQAQGQPVDARSDIFSFGCVLYELIRGARAFQGSSKVETLRAILEREPFDDYWSTIPRNIDYIIRRCLEKKTDDRFRSAIDLNEALITLFDMGREEKECISPTYTRNILSGTPGSPPIAHYACRRLTFGNSSVYRGRFTAHGDKVVYTSGTPRTGLRVFITGNSYLDTKQLAVPVGSYAAAVSCHDELALIADLQSPLEGGHLVRSFLSGPPSQQLVDGVLDADWSPDGLSLAVLRRESGKTRIEFPMGNPIYEKEAPAAASMYGLRVSPNGRWLAFFEYLNNSCLLTTVDRAGKKQLRHTVAQGGTSVWEISWLNNSEEIWFSSPAVQSGDIFAVDHHGTRRIVWTVPGNCTLVDVSNAGKMLLNLGNPVLGVGYVNRLTNTEGDLSILDRSFLGALASDGSTALITEMSEATASEGRMFLKRPGELPTPCLGEGFAQSISRDQKWIVAARTDQQVVLPTGPGQSHVFKNVRGYVIAFNEVERSILVWRWVSNTHCQFVLTRGAQDEYILTHIPKNWLTTSHVSVFSNAFTGIRGFVLSEDNQHIVVADPCGRWHVYSLRDGGPAHVGSVDAGDVPLAWHQGHLALFVTDRRAASPYAIQIYRLDVITGKKTIWDEMVADDIVYNPKVTPDGKCLAYNYRQLYSDLHAATAAV